MMLHHNKEITRNTTVEAANGTAFPALIVFSLTLRYFRDHALRELTDATGAKVLPEDIRWVITVPAIWRQKAKQFIREAAYEVNAPRYNNTIFGLNFAFDYVYVQIVYCNTL